MLKPGWLNRQFEKVENEVKDWPDWMQREAGFEPKYENTTSEQTCSKGKTKDQSNK